MRTDFIVSDIHLGGVSTATERRFLRFLEHVGTHGRSLLLAGDLFDFWFEYGSVIPGEHFRVLAGLADLVEAGVPVTMVGGNHDAWGGPFLEEQVGIDFHADSIRMKLAGRPALVAHGDGVGEGDLKYRLLKSVIRSRAAVLAFRALHPELGVALARRVSGTGHRVESGNEVSTRGDYLRDWARGRLEEEPGLAYVVCGHAHSPLVEEMMPGRYYLNAGDWLRHFSYIRFSPDGVPELHSWSAAEPSS